MDVSNTSIRLLHAALATSRKIDCRHDDVKKLQDSAEALFFVRRAVLFGIIEVKFFFLQFDYMFAVIVIFFKAIGFRQNGKKDISMC